jgi:signal transduction histidine kinase
MNLIVNACQAMGDRGALTLRTRLREDGDVEIQVQDTGPGIGPEHLERIFDPGFTTKGAGVGTGLGLSICYNIVGDHSGELRVESQVGEGARDGA